MKERDFPISVAKIMALISCAVTAQLICIFVFAYAKSRFSHDAAHMFVTATRVMIFSQYRDSVQEITDMLNVHRPLVKVMSFIGQSSAGKSTKGFTQKEQLQVCGEDSLYS